MGLTQSKNTDVIVLKQVEISKDKQEFSITNEHVILSYYN